MSKKQHVSHDWPDRVTKRDLRFDYYRGTGAGGQKRNKTSSACRITHLPTGLNAQSEEQRSQHQNKLTAWGRLREQLIPLMLDEQPKQRYASGFERVRTYHEPDSRVTDTRVPDRQWRYDDVLNGDAIGEIIDAVALCAPGESMG